MSTVQNVNPILYVFFSNIEIYQAAYSEHCPVQVAEFQHCSNPNKQKFQFNLNTDGKYYTSIYASREFSEEQIKELARILHKAITAKKSMTAGLEKATKQFAYFQIEDNDKYPEFKIGRIATTPEELQLIININNLVN